MSLSSSATPETITEEMKGKVVLKSCELEEFEVNVAVAVESGTLKQLVLDVGTNGKVPVPNLSSTILAKVIEYCKKHVEARAEGDDKESLKEWDKEFVKVDQNILFDLILAANYLNINNLLDLTCQTVADMIKGKSPEDIRIKFNIEKDFTD